MKFIVIVCAAFLARVNPVSTIANPACMNITRNPATNVHTKLIATVFAAEAALAALASESAAGTPCPATTSGHARVISRPRPTERLIRPPSEGYAENRCYWIRAKIAQMVAHFATTQSGSVHQCRKNRADFARFCVHRYVLVSPRPRRPVPLDTVSGPRAAFRVKR